MPSRKDVRAQNFSRTVPQKAGSPRFNAGGALGVALLHELRVLGNGGALLG